MKNRIFLGIALITILSCKTEPVKDYIVLSGTLKNYTGNELILGSGLRFSKNIKVNKKGAFLDTLRIDSRYYSFHDGKKLSVKLYLEKGKDVALTTDVKDKTNAVAFKGESNNVTINNYLSKKQALVRRTSNHSYTGTDSSPADCFVDEETFLKMFSTLKEDKQALAKASDLPKYFLQMELKHIYYTYLLTLRMYTNQHKGFIKNKSFPLAVEMNKLDLNDEIGYKTSHAYRSIVYGYCFDMSEEQNKNDDIYSSAINFLDFVHKKVTNTYIANNLLYDIAIDRIANYYTTETEINSSEEIYEKFMNYATDKANKKEVTEAYSRVKKMAKGQPSPKFVNFENYDGGITSLDDLKGKYVYIDIWATWCGPCIVEMPFLKKIEKQYHGKNIQFLSISKDNKKNCEAWKKMIKEKKLGGIQVLAGNDSQFEKDYNIMAIPRFILLDPEGKIISSNAPRPSDPKLIDLFTEQGI